MTGHNLTDLGNAARLVERHGADLRYCHALGEWLIWDGTRWDTDGSGEIMRRAADTVRSMYAQAAATEDDGARQALVKHARASEAAPRLRAMIDLATSEPGIPVAIDELDTHPDLFNAANCTVHLPTGEARPQRREDMLTKRSPVIFDENATCLTWLTFLATVSDNRPHLVDYLRRLTGYALTGRTSEQVLPILHGRGANGKTTFLEAVRIGAGDYGSQTATDTLMERPQGAIPNDLARLRGARFVSAVETDEGRRLAEGTVKRITGGDVIAARFLHREWFEYRPEFTVFLAANHKPTVRGTDDAIWRRLHLVPFDVTIPAEDRDSRLPEKLAAEAPGILAWAVAGAMEWYRDGLKPPAEVLAATADYRTESDTIGTFLADACQTGPDATCTKADLYAAYVKWCEANGERPMTQRRLGGQLRDSGIDEYQQTGGTRDRCWLGIGLEEVTPWNGTQRNAA